MIRFNPFLTRLFLFTALLFSLPGWGKEPKEGQKLFEMRCARCHGRDAKGSMEMAMTLKLDPVLLDLTRNQVVQKPLADLVKLIASGHGKMPKQKAWLTDAQIWEVAKYLQSLQRAYASGKDRRQK